MATNQPRPDGPSYDLTVTIAGRGEQKFKGTLTTWDPLTGNITLGPEDRGEPLGLFVFTLTGEGNNIGDPPEIIGARFSTTKARVGTAAELQGELFGATNPRCDLEPYRRVELQGAVLTPEWATGHVCMVLAGLEPDGVPSYARIIGEFAAFAP